MALSIDKALGIHQYAMQLRSARGELIASNLANADTPGYQSRDFDFQAALAHASGVSQPSSLRTTHSSHFAANGNNSLGVALQYRIPVESSVDGNTVDMDQEKARFSENAMRYQASLSFVDSKIKGLIRAIRGD